MKTIVISAVNIRKGGTLTILKQCLEYLSGVASYRQWRVIAIVHRKDLCQYPSIEYIEMPEVASSWARRLWCEYVTMHKISQKLQPIDLWFSLHDTTPRVKARNQAVYCQTSFPFLKWRLQDLRFDPKIVLFALFTRFAYRLNIHKNRYLVVQTNWLREGFSKMFGITASRFIVAPPKKPNCPEKQKDTKVSVCRFFFPSTPDCHKNFELACQAASLLEQEVGDKKFELIITIEGNENKYAKWLYRRWGKCNSIRFVGFLTQAQLFDYYGSCTCLVYPSRVETWGLAISEYSVFNKPILLADLPYAHETASGQQQVAFFNVKNAHDLKNKMRSILNKDYSILSPIPKNKIKPPKTDNWETLFEQLLS